MNRVLNISQILVYYDFPHIFIANDLVGTDYLCMLATYEEDEATFLAIQISKNKLIGFLNGSLDLRDVFENPEIKQWFTFNSIEDNVIANTLDLTPKRSAPHPAQAPIKKAKYNNNKTLKYPDAESAMQAKRFNKTRTPTAHLSTL